MPTLSVEVRTLDRQAMRVTAEPSETVGALKQRLAQMRAADHWSSSMNLILEGKFLDDGDTLQSCGLQDGAFVVATGVTPRPLPNAPCEPDLDWADDRISSTGPVAARHYPSCSTMERDGGTS